MFLNLLILSAILVAFLMAALAVKTIFGDENGFESMTCHSSDEKSNESVCAACDIKDIADCNPSGTYKFTKKES